MRIEIQDDRIALHWRGRSLILREPSADLVKALSGERVQRVVRGMVTSIGAPDTLPTPGQGRGVTVWETAPEMPAAHVVEVLSVAGLMPPHHRV